MRGPVIRPRTPKDFQRVLRKADERVPLWLLRKRLRARIGSPKDGVPYKAASTSLPRAAKPAKRARK